MHSFHGGVAARTACETDVRQLLEVVRLHDLEGRLRAARQEDCLKPGGSAQLAMSCREPLQNKVDP